MEKTRFVVEYLAEGGSDVESMFLEATSEQEAKEIVLAKCGTFSTILSCQPTKTNHGLGKQTTLEVSETVEVESKPKVKNKKAVVVSDTTPKQPKINNKQKVAIRAMEIKAAKGSKEELYAWIIENVTKSESMAQWHVKQNWKLV